MSSIGEALGMSSPARLRRRRSTLVVKPTPTTPAGRRQDAAAGITPRHDHDQGAFENAIALTSSVGGSTNAVLHLLAIANEARVALHLDDFNRIAARVPHIADMKPGGKFHMIELDRVGGVPVVCVTSSRRGCSTATR